MLRDFLLGKLSLDALPLHNAIVGFTDLTILIIAAVVLIGITWMKKWGYLWREWISTVDHKRIGVMYIILAGVMLLRGFADAIMMRLQQALSVGHSMGYLPPDHFSQIFTAHGVIMIFFMAMPFMFGLINLALPLQLGARDVAYPYLNSLSLWLTVMGAGLVMMSLIVGEFAKTGWLAYPPLSEMKYSPGVGVDYYIWAVQISGVGSLLSGINFTATILKMRCPGLTLMRMPVFCWTVLCAMVLVMLAFPILTGTLAMLFLDRFFGFHFFTIAAGGNQMMYVNLIWAWGHPEVYILILPAFGIFSEVTATFCKKKLFGYATMVGATIAITFLSFIVWLHHFFTMGAGANVNAFFGIATMIIAIPTGVKIFNWLFTMYKGRIEFTSPMMWTCGFLLTFVVGGMTGVMMSIPAADFQFHNSEFLIAHFHNVIIGGVVFGYFAGLIYWWPKIFGFKLNERLGKWAFWFWQIGFLVAFMPLYFVGLKGMTRRLYHYSAASGFHPYLIAAAVGSLIIFFGVILLLLQFIVGIIQREKNRVTNDPWGGRTLEWTIPSPAPFYNFSKIPEVHSRDSFWEMKQDNDFKPNRDFSKIHMPKNTGTGFIIALFGGIFCFAMTWHIHWLSVLGILGIITSVIVRSTNRDIDYYVPVDEVKQCEQNACYGDVK